ncbi:MAG: hypothetical protein IKA51_02290 [Clostridia bacterium]|nr:hypothetical protein [Clostridia bacterium]
MKCNNCGYEDVEVFKFCPKCGAVAVTEDAVSCEAPVEATRTVNAAAEKILGIIKDPLFLTVCILVSVSSGLSVVFGSFPVLSILATVFLWIIFAKGCSNKVEAGQLKWISGVTYANYIVNMVVCSIFAAVGVIFAILFSFATVNSELLGYIMEASENEPSLAEILAMLEAANIGFAFVMVIVFIVFAVVGVVGIVLNLFSWRYIHAMTKSVYKSVEKGELKIEKASAAYAWLMAFGVINAVSAVFSIGGQDIILTFLTTGVMAAALIIASILVKKSFK